MRINLYSSTTQCCGGRRSRWDLSDEAREKTVGEKTKKSDLLFANNGFICEFLFGK